MAGVRSVNERGVLSRGLVFQPLRSCPTWKQQNQEHLINISLCVLASTSEQGERCVDMCVFCFKAL